MIGAVEKEFRPAGNRAEPPDDQPFVVNRIMVQYIVLLKESRIGYEIVVNGVVANLDGGVLHYGIQVHGLRVAGPGIYFRVHFSGQYVMQRYTIYAEYFGAKINLSTIFSSKSYFGRKNH